MSVFELQYPDPRYRIIDLKVLLDRPRARVVFYVYESLCFLSSAALMIGSLFAGFVLGWLLGFGGSSWIMAVWALFLALYVNSKIRRRVPFRCPECREFMNREIVEWGKMESVVYVCHKSRTYVDTGIRIGD